ncbi:hypothetical protein [Zooshikella ganghwensis]|uniref:hypothetical protein n=1 Tax=Zooshikella ganghwensis TaxID=202772 RepID=UPI0012FA7130|nr:hypothetical protein [Zooshikella ganghwensis]
MMNKNNQGRRHFLKLGIIGSFTLATAGTLIPFFSRQLANPAPNYKVLRAHDIDFFHCITPVIVGLGKYQPHSDMETFFKALDDKLGYLTDSIKHQLQQIIDLFTAPATKGLLTGKFNGNWQTFDYENVEQLWGNWQTSRWSVLQQASSAISQLVLIVWYSLAEHWPAINYPGPLFTEQLVTRPNNF